MLAMHLLLVVHGKGIDELIGGPKNSFYKAWLDKEIEQVSIDVGEIDKLRNFLNEDPVSADVEQQLTKCWKYWRTAAEDCKKALESEKSSKQHQFVVTAKDEHRGKLVFTKNILIIIKSFNNKKVFHFPIFSNFPNLSHFSHISQSHFSLVCPKFSH